MIIMRLVLLVPLMAVLLVTFVFLLLACGLNWLISGEGQKITARMRDMR